MAPVATPVRARPAVTETPQSSPVEPTMPSAEVSVPAPGEKPTKPKKVLTRQVGRFQRVCLLKCLLNWVWVFHGVPYTLLVEFNFHWPYMFFLFFGYLYK